MMIVLKMTIIFCLAAEVEGAVKKATSLDYGQDIWHARQGWGGK